MNMKVIVSMTANSIDVNSMALQLAALLAQQQQQGEQTVNAGGDDFFTADSLDFGDAEVTSRSGRQLNFVTGQSLAVTLPEGGRVAPGASITLPDGSRQPFVAVRGEVVARQLGVAEISVLKRERNDGSGSFLVMRSTLTLQGGFLLWNENGDEVRYNPFGEKYPVESLRNSKFTILTETRNIERESVQAIITSLGLVARPVTANADTQPTDTQRTQQLLGAYGPKVAVNATPGAIYAQSIANSIPVLSFGVSPKTEDDPVGMIDPITSILESVAQDVAMAAKAPGRGSFSTNLAGRHVAVTSNDGGKTWHEKPEQGFMPNRCALWEVNGMRVVTGPKAEKSEAVTDFGF